MSLATLFTGGKRVQILTNNNAVLLEVDATPSINHSRVSQLTKSPVDNGSELSDHINLENKQVSLECIVVKNPFNFFSSALSTVASATLGTNPFTAGLAASLGGLLLRSSNRVEDSYLLLNQLWENRVPFTVVAGFEIYTNVVILKLSIPENSKTKNAVKFNLTLEQIKFATTETIIIQALSDIETSIRTTPPIRKGQQVLKEVDQAVQKKASSFLFKVGGIIAGESN